MSNSESMQSQLSGIRSKVPHGRRPNNRQNTSVMPSPNKVGVDGIDHINIWENAGTELGVFLSHGFQAPYNHSVLGRFNTIEALWYYIRYEERDDRLRTIRPRGIKRFAALNLNRDVRVENFQAIIMDANWQKLMAYPKFMRMIKESDLPFDMYYVNRETNIRRRPEFAYWVVPAFEAIRKAVKEHSEPDFSYLMENKGIDLYAPLREEAPPPPPAPAKVSLYDATPEAIDVAEQEAEENFLKDAEDEEAAETPIAQEVHIHTDGDLEIHTQADMSVHAESIELSTDSSGEEKEETVDSEDSVELNESNDELDESDDN